MQRKLQCILVDDDPTIHDIFKDYLSNCEYAEITDYYIDPIEFLNSNKKPDLVFLDIVMPNIDGFSLALKIKPTPVILFTGLAEYFKDIMNMVETLDAFPKPIVKDRLIKSVMDAYLLLNPNKQSKKHELFHTNLGKINISYSDILFVKTIKNSHRYLETFLKGGRKVILKGYSLEYIQNNAKFLLQPNRAELVSPDVIGKIEHNFIIHLHNINDNGKPVNSLLCRSFRKNFLYLLNSFQQ